MTREEAQAEAVRRWGKPCELVIRKKTVERWIVRSIGPTGPYMWEEAEYEVWQGDHTMGGCKCMAVGDSWESAFADASRREGKPRKERT